jgi:nucleotide-binding universal stress UspA family protein
MAQASSFRTILVPVDGSPLAEQALPLARRIALRAGSKLRLALVHQTPTAPLDPVAARQFIPLELAARKWERSYQRSLQAKLRQEGVRVASAVTLKGSVGPALARYAQELGVDLVVMATHGRGGVRRAWLGSVADYLVRQLQVPVLLVRPREDGAATTGGSAASQILVPLDGSALAEDVLEPAADLARLWESELTLLRVVHPVVLFSDETLGWPAPFDEQLTADLRSQAESYVRDISERLRGEGLRASGVAVVGWGAADAILKLARPETVAAVAIATHGRGGLQRLALGSVADKLIRAADVPVLVHRPVQSAKPKSRRAKASRAEGRAGR